MIRRSLALLAVLCVGPWLPNTLHAAPPRLQQLLAEQARRVTERPTDAGAHNDLANLLVLTGDYGPAAEQYRRAIDLDPGLSSARYNLGLLRFEAGLLRDAERHFQKVLDLEPGHGLTHYRLGDIDAARSRNSKASRHYAQAFRLDPSLAHPESHPEVLFNRLAGWARTRVYLTPAPGLRPRKYDDPAPLAQLIVGDLRVLREMVAEPPPEEAPPAGETDHSDEATSESEEENAPPG